MMGLRHGVAPKLEKLMIYAYVTLNVTNPDSFAQYRERAQSALDKYGGVAVTVSKAARALEGTPTIPQFGVLLSFPDEASATGWIEDEALQEIHELRRGAGETSITLLA